MSEKGMKIVCHNCKEIIPFAKLFGKEIIYECKCGKTKLEVMMVEHDLETLNKY